ncbi:LOW QUALITY PROTEIN: protein trichome birefringence-like 6 [Actinidia eriantha]|uniref:LOW QUALITY PROTEIN: protein trichome birefringence-like 6 n=1 Tax=Actinidia eriantha TaxID=165200 RepID=UPI00258EDF61|nr:LOW QUALITY PROTEIN: protein trichome birefringence-like 6 [Actinidia eriantha]
MERQRSFSVKTTRFLVFALTITSSLVFLIFFSISLIKTTPSVHQETHFHFNNPTLGLGLKPSTVQTSTAFSTNTSAIEASNPILIGTHIRKEENSSRFANFSRFDANEESGSQVSGDARNGNLMGTRFKKSENTSGFSENSIIERLQRKENESKVTDDEIYTSDAVNGKFTTMQKNVFEKKEVSSGERIKEKNSRICDITKGRWEFDESYPLYTNASCPFIDEGFNCEGNGRLDKDYSKWRWQPQDCEIPRFNAKKMLELIKGKRLVFVGDSINRNQWESMLCLLMGAIKDPKRVYETHGRRITKEKGDYSFKFVDYKCTVEYYVTHFLVHESKARIGKKRVQTLRIDAIDKGSSRWKGADILVFNTAHWWTHFKTKAGINYYQEGNQVHPHLDVLIAFRRALVTWASWVDKHINPGKTRVFFQSSAPTHFRGGKWNSGGHCNKATQPLHETVKFNYPEKNSIVEEVIRQMKSPVTLLNVTGLTEYRIDGHPSIYGRKSGKSYSLSIQDCSHWCLPGVPDTWNELLYFHFQSKKIETEIL